MISGKRTVVLYHKKAHTHRNMPIELSNQNNQAVKVGAVIQWQLFDILE